QRNVGVDWHRDVLETDVPSHLAVGEPDGQDSTEEQLTLHLEAVLVRHRPLEVRVVPVRRAERKPVRGTELVQLWDEIAVQIAARGLAIAGRPGARVARRPHWIQASVDADVDRLIVAARGKLDRRPAVARDVV